MILFPVEKRALIVHSWTVYGKMQNISIGYSLLATYKKQGCLCIWQFQFFFFTLMNILILAGCSNVTRHSSARKGWAQGFKFPAQVLPKEPKHFYMCPEEDPYPFNCRADIAETQTKNFILPLAEWQHKLNPSYSSYCLLLKWKHCFGKNGSLWTGMETCGKALMKPRTWSPYILLSVLCQWKRSPQPWQNWSPHLQWKWPP